MKRTDITDVFPDATAEQIDKLIGIHGADINSAKAGVDDLRTQLATAQQEITKLKATPPAGAADDRVTALQQELDALKAANSIRDIRDKVAQEHKIPVSLLTGETEEACAAQAQAILDFSRGSYPQLKDGGEPTNPTTESTRDIFAAWAKESL